jgi:hypothetical protein
MVSASNFSSSYAKALVTSSKREDLRKPPGYWRASVVTTADLRLMEREMTRVQREFKAVEAGYGQDMVALVIAAGYLAKLISNARIQQYLNENHPEVLNEFKAIVSAASLEGINN